MAFLLNVSSLLQSTNPRILQNYVIWRFMMNRASSLPKKIRSTREQFDRVFKGTSAEPSRATTCSNYVNDNMGFAVSRLYVKQFFPEESRNQSKEIIKNIRASMINLIQNASWMDADSKAKAVDKVTQISPIREQARTVIAFRKWRSMKTSAIPITSLATTPLNWRRCMLR